MPLPSGDIKQRSVEDSGGRRIGLTVSREDGDEAISGAVPTVLLLKIATDQMRHLRHARTLRQVATVTPDGSSAMASLGFGTVGAVCWICAVMFRPP